MCTKSSFHWATCRQKKSTRWFFFKRTFSTYSTKDPDWTHLEMKNTVLPALPSHWSQCNRPNWCSYLSICWRRVLQWQVRIAVPLNTFICNPLKLFPAWLASQSHVKSSADCTCSCLASTGTFSLYNRQHVKAVCKLIQPLIVLCFTDCC